MGNAVRCDFHLDECAPGTFYTNKFKIKLNFQFPDAVL